LRVTAYNFRSYGNISFVQRPSPETLRLWTAFLAAHRRLTTALDTELRRLASMSLDEYDVLYQLAQAGRPLRMSELAGRVLISRPAATRVVDRLVRRGWLDRRNDDRDRRTVLVSITEPGRREQRRAGRLHLDGLARLVERPLEGVDHRGLAAALEALAAAPARLA
jgi:DNA-binding MarR family transcriptional regulator